MGVSGSGKSTIAKTIARKLRIKYIDADSFHSPENVKKMASGTPLTDEERLPWLQSLRTVISEAIASDTSVTLACSALKKSYREILNPDPKFVHFAYLKGSYELFAKRLSRRQSHFMKESMLSSQFATLEEPQADEAIICDARKGIMEIAAQVISELNSRYNSQNELKS
jgi:carbohydrate kinase (thermoresistant glucokinase family)